MRQLADIAGPAHPDRDGVPITADTGPPPRVATAFLFKGLAMTAGKSPSRVVVTGVGVISPIGIGNERFWRSLASGRSGIDCLSSVPSQGLLSKVAAEVRDFNPLDYVYEKKFLKVMSRDIQLGVSAASLAMQDSGLKAGDIDPDRLGVEFGAGHISFTPEELVDAAR